MGDLQPRYTLRRDDQGFASAIERDGYTVLILATGATRNEEEAERVVRELNQRSTA